MKLIIGLGNPGEKYEKTRHSAGFLAVDKIASNLQFPSFEFHRTFNAEISKDMINDEKVIMVKPQTFMNNSGVAVKAMMDYYEIRLENIIVIHDDLDITIGEYKAIKNRGSAGHKGVQSIMGYLGTEDFKRIRIGVGAKYSGLAVLFEEKDHRKIPVEKFVLQKFSDEEMVELEKVIDEIVNNIGDLLER
ncbi:MAG: aminoacyl-tRNA hydrolase [Patescibacteria group bacterium]|nr:aminoacyl-tRNA hydrolase [Patescibacteria group bacterium]